MINKTILKPFTRPYDVIAFDLETTGFNAPDDEVLQISLAAINIDKNDDSTLITPLINTYVKPSHKTKWPEAMAVNHITPEMVASAPLLDEIKDTIISYLTNAKVIVSYNGRKTELGEPWPGFDRPFLEKSGIPTGDAEDFDVMIKFKTRTGMPCYSKLGYTSKFLGYDLNEDAAHDSMEDVIATAFCYRVLNSLETEPDYKFKPYGSILIKLDHRKDDNGEFKLNKYGKKIPCYTGNFEYLYEPRKLTRYEVITDDCAPIIVVSATDLRGIIKIYNDGFIEQL